MAPDADSFTDCGNSTSRIVRRGGGGISPANHAVINLDSFIPVSDTVKTYSMQNGTLQIESHSSEGEDTIRSNSFFLHSGAYEVKIEYQNQQEGLSHSLGEVSFQEQRFTGLLQSSTIILDGAHTKAIGRIIVPFGANAQSVVAQIKTSGDSQGIIKSITLSERRIYRVVRLIGFLLGFFILDWILYCLFVNPTYAQSFVKRHRTTIVLGAICILAVLPILNDVDTAGDDYGFHMLRISYVAEELRNHQFPVRMQTGMMNGYGYATSLYYCDLFLYLPAVLYNCMVPLFRCDQIYVIFVTALSCAICYYSLQRVTEKDGISLVGTAIYILSVYRISNVFLRSAMGEYTAMAFLPLVICGMYEIFIHEHPTPREWFPLAVGMACLLQSHLLSFEIACLLLGAFCILEIRRVFTWEKIKALLSAAGTAMGLSAWFLIPLLQSMMTQSVKINDTYVTNFQTRGTTLFPALSLFTNSYGEGVRGMLGFGIVLSALISIFVFWNRKNSNDGTAAAERSVGVFCGFGIALFILSLRSFPWNCLFSNLEHSIFHKFLGAAQFPWRYLAFATAFLVFAVCMSFVVLRRKNSTLANKMILGVLCATLLSLMSVYQFLGSTGKSSTLCLNTTDSTGISGAEYLLENAANVETASPLAGTESLQILTYDRRNGTFYISVTNASTESFVDLPIYDYGNYHAYDERGKEWETTTSEQSLIRITIPANYSGTLSVAYKEPLLWRFMELVSFVTFFGIVIFCFRTRKKNQMS